MMNNANLALALLFASATNALPSVYSNGYFGRPSSGIYPSYYYGQPQPYYGYRPYWGPAYYRPSGYGNAYYGPGGPGPFAGQGYRYIGRAVSNGSPSNDSPSIPNTISRVAAQSDDNSNDQSGGRSDGDALFNGSQDGQIVSEVPVNGGNQLGLARQVGEVPQTIIGASGDQLGGTSQVAAVGQNEATSRKTGAEDQSEPADDSEYDNPQDDDTEDEYSEDDDSDGMGDSDLQKDLTA